jgi:hypothetical protein
MDVTGVARVLACGAFHAAAPSQPRHGVAAARPAGYPMTFFDHDNHRRGKRSGNAATIRKSPAQKLFLSD